MPSRESTNPTPRTRGAELIATAAHLHVANTAPEGVI
ncbi:hypothetical protein Ae168Ps1_4646c [Pseudonocardia sp. Ae168_Ps1]|nr:hypothetical protein Ae150APs1_4619c [Pseudonocardia sp. Ae150A_Ps1]OLL82240.1 hypothetical protein Ae168Ps1_4646c [Pseudonocardia sp. Ae168_Ps1]OLL83644.1 hypothetical protein Ae263Ps1_0699 [Pseudonocardia sp. Ae263_Ps1]OLL90316.1 hypothetical protein Ae356Ps1_0213c [Pseudonocardia sp. Ae356_Ps1]